MDDKVDSYYYCRLWSVILSIINPFQNENEFSTFSCYISVYIRKCPKFNLNSFVLKMTSCHGGLTSSNKTTKKYKIQFEKI